MFLISSVYFENVITAAAAAAFFYFLIVISFIDASHFIIPDVLSLPFFAFSLALLLIGNAVFPELLPLTGKKGIAAGLAGSLMLALFFFLVDGLARLVFKKQGIGAGDIKLGLSIGIYTGYYSLLAPLFGYFLMGFSYPFLKGRIKNGYLPFGPFLSAGAVFVVFEGQTLIAWYVRTFF